MTRGRSLRTGAVLAVAAALALAGCTSSPEPTPTRTRDFCAIATDLAAPPGDGLTNFTSIASAAIDDPESVTNTMALDLRTAAARASAEFEGYAALLREAGAAAGDPDVDKAFSVVAVEFDNLVTVVDGQFADVSTAEQVGPALSTYLAKVQDLGTDAAFDAAYSTADAFVVDTCGYGIEQTTEAEPNAMTPDAAAKTLVGMLAKEIATYMVDWDGTGAGPIITEDAGAYYIDGDKIADAVDGVTFTNEIIVNATSWCVEVTTDGTGTPFSYDARNGPQQAACE